MGFFGNIYDKTSNFLGNAWDKTGEIGNNLITGLNNFSNGIKKHPILGAGLNALENVAKKEVEDYVNKKFQRNSK